MITGSLLTALRIRSQRDCVMLREAYWNEESFVGVMIPSPPSLTGSAIDPFSLSLSEI